MAFKLGGVVINGNPIDGIWRFFEENGWWHLFWDCDQWGTGRESWFGFSKPIMSGPINVPLWFLRDLFIVVLLTPIIEWFLKYFRHYGVILLAFCYASHTWFDIHGLSISAIFFFSAGAYLSLNNKSLVMECSRVKVPFFVISVVLFMMMMWYDGPFTKAGHDYFSLFVMAMVVSIINISSMLVKKGLVKVNKWLSNSSFFIYVFHTIILVPNGVGFICAHIFDSMNPLVMTLKYFSQTILIVLVCLSAYWLMQKCFPKFLNILMGSR